MEENVHYSVQKILSLYTIAGQINETKLEYILHNNVRTIILRTMGRASSMYEEYLNLFIV
jgi:hypothetical protein